VVTQVRQSEVIFSPLFPGLILRVIPPLGVTTLPPRLDALVFAKRLVASRGAISL